MLHIELASLGVIPENAQPRTKAELAPLCEAVLFGNFKSALCSQAGIVLQPQGKSAVRDARQGGDLFGCERLGTIA